MFQAPQNKHTNIADPDRETSRTRHVKDHNGGRHCGAPREARSAVEHDVTGLLTVGPDTRILNGRLPSGCDQKDQKDPINLRVRAPKSHSYRLRRDTNLATAQASMASLVQPGGPQPLPGEVSFHRKWSHARWAQSESAFPCGLSA